MMWNWDTMQPTLAGLTLIAFLMAIVTACIFCFELSRAMTSQEPRRWTRPSLWSATLLYITMAWAANSYVRVLFR